MVILKEKIRSYMKNTNQYKRLRNPVIYIRKMVAIIKAVLSGRHSSIKGLFLSKNIRTESFQGWVLE
jgi:hypothetical protein